jgi:6-phosphogluconolactonase
LFAARALDQIPTYGPLSWSVPGCVSGWEALRDRFGTQTLTTLPADYRGNNSTAEIQIDQAGRWLYVTNRGHDSIAAYAVDPAKGTLAPIGHIPSGGRTPRNITIDPTNQYLIAANQNGENLVVFRIDSKTGNLTPTGAAAQVPQPGGVYFVKAE